MGEMTSNLSMSVTDIADHEQWWKHLLYEPFTTTIVNDHGGKRPPANTKRWPNTGSMLGHHLRRRPSNKQAFWASIGSRCRVCWVESKREALILNYIIDSIIIRDDISPALIIVITNRTLTFSIIFISSTSCWRNLILEINYIWC